MPFIEIHTIDMDDPDHPQLEQTIIVNLHDVIAISEDLLGRGRRLEFRDHDKQDLLVSDSYETIKEALRKLNEL